MNFFEQRTKNNFCFSKKLFSNKCFFLIIAFIIVFSCSSVYAKKLKYGPVQEFAGPGGREYQHKSFTTWESGIFPHERYMVFEPAEPTPEKAGLVLIIHDLLNPSPLSYMGQIRHLCRKGWIVLFPYYQGTDQLEKHFMFNIIRSTKDFLRKSFDRNKMQVDHTKFAIFGHGAGAVLAANTAATYDYFGLPVPKVLLISMPNRDYIKMLDLNGISRETRMAVITGDRVPEEDAVAASEIFYTAKRVKTVNKIFISIQSDYYGQPPLIGNRAAALSPEYPPKHKVILERRNEYLHAFKSKHLAQYIKADDIENFDWKVDFRVFDMLAIAAFNLNSDLKPMKSSEEFRSMGYWSDGRKVKPLIVTDRP